MKKPVGGAEGAAGAQALGQPRLVCWRLDGGAESANCGQQVKGRRAASITQGLATPAVPLREVGVLAG